MEKNTRLSDPTDCMVPSPRSSICWKCASPQDAHKDQRQLWVPLSEQSSARVTSMNWCRSSMTLPKAACAGVDRNCASNYNLSGLSGHMKEGVGLCLASWRCMFKIGEIRRITVVFASLVATVMWMFSTLRPRVCCGRLASRAVHGGHWQIGPMHWWQQRCLV